MRNLRIYLASSWRNDRQPALVTALRAVGHDVYDFRNPEPGEHGFAWSEIEPTWKHWSTREFVVALEDPIAKDGFNKDMAALNWADVTVLLLPCGRSAHLELGYAIGRGQATVIYMPELPSPELMYKMVDGIYLTETGLLTFLQETRDRLAAVGALAS